MGFLEVMLEAISQVNLHKIKLTKLLLLPFLILTALGILSFYIRNTLVGFACAFLSLMVLTIFAITIHRVILLGYESVNNQDIYKWSKRETTFALYAAGMYLAMATPVILIFVKKSPPDPGMLDTWLLLIPLIMITISRWSLVFPSIAVDKKMPLTLSWKLTGNHRLLMFLIVVVFPALFPTNFLYKQLAGTILRIFLFTLSIIFTVAALSVAYRFICKENDPHVIED